ncbi:MAG: oxidoreductase [Gammaproteobacteria bacterium HGW-Gammaproteobacteria-12]|nr:MAG: oxidoreductase [Gammaproteobacteria bacterium HGW-Gammaproteobacteria-12]
MRRIELAGVQVPVIGQGTWRMGEDERQRSREVAALLEGLDLGLSLVDTAEMYGEGGAELVVGEAIAGRRDEVFLVSKVYPHNASRDGVQAACERSLKRLGCERIDLYLLHWRGRLMAYCPLGQAGTLLDESALLEVAQRHGVKPAQVALAWVLRQDGVIAIPKAVGSAHLRDNAAAASITLNADDLTLLDAAFAPPQNKRPLEMV